MKESNKFHLSDRKWKKRALAFLLAFVVTLTAVPLDVVSAQNGSTTDENINSEENVGSGDAGGIAPLAETVPYAPRISLYGVGLDADYLAGIGSTFGQSIPEPLDDKSIIEIELEEADKKTSVTDENGNPVIIKADSEIENGAYGEIVRYKFFAVDGTDASGNEILTEITEQNILQYAPHNRYWLSGTYYVEVEMEWNNAKVPAGTPTTIRSPFLVGADGLYYETWGDEDAVDNNGIYVIHYTGEEIPLTLREGLDVKEYPIKDGRLYKNGLIRIEGPESVKDLTPAGEVVDVKIYFENVLYRKYFRDKESLYPDRNDPTLIAHFKYRVEYDEFTEDEKDVLETWMGLLGNNKPDKDGVYWCAIGEAVKIGIGGDRYSNVEISLDGQTWVRASEGIPYIVEDEAEVEVQIRSILNNYEGTATVKIGVDNVMPSGSFTVNGVTFDRDNSDNPYTNQLFIRDNNIKEDPSDFYSTDYFEVSYSVDQKKAGAAVKEIAFGVAREGVKPDNIAWDDVFGFASKLENGKYTGTHRFTFGNLYNIHNLTYGSNVIWMRITDEVNNVTYISSDNVIIYKDLESAYVEGDESTYLTYNKSLGGNLYLPFTQSEDAFELPERDSTTGNLKVDNYIDSVAISKDGGDYQELAYNVDYKVEWDDGYSDVPSTLRDKAYLELNKNCFADATMSSEYMVRVLLKPYLKTPVEKHNLAVNGENELPQYVYFKIVMGKGQSSISIAPVNGSTTYAKVYDGTPYDKFSFDTVPLTDNVNVKHAKLAYNGTTPITNYEYYKNNNLWLDEAPVDAGKYFLYAGIEFGPDDLYGDSYACTTYEITPRPVDAYIEVDTKTYDGTTDSPIKNITVNTTITSPEKKELFLNPDAFSAVFRNPNVGDSINVYVKVDDDGNPVINKDEEGNDIPLIDPDKEGSDLYANYEIKFHSTIASIIAKDVIIKLSEDGETPLTAITSVYGDKPNTKLQENVTAKNFILDGIVEADQSRLDYIKNSLTFSTDATYSSGVNAVGYEITAKSTVAPYKMNYKFIVDTKIQITPRPIQVTWTQPNPSTYTYDARYHEVVANVTNKAVSQDRIVLKYTTTRSSDGKSEERTSSARIKEVGTYTTTLAIVGNDNYIVPEDCVFNWTINPYVVTNAKPTVTFYGAPEDDDRPPYGNGVEGWFKSNNLIIQAPDGFMIASKPKNIDDQLQFGFSFEVYDLDEGVNEISYYLQNIQSTSGYLGCITGEMKLQVAVDTNPATGSIDLTDKSNKLYEAVDSILGYFFGKELVSFRINYEDIPAVDANGDGTPDFEISGIHKVSYGVIRETDDYEDIVWKEYKKASGSTVFTTTDTTDIGRLDSVMNPNDIPVVVWVKIIDKAGNITELNSAGIVIYKEAGLTTTNIQYAKYQLSSKEVFVTFNNNKIKSIDIYKKNQDESLTYVKTLVDGIDYVPSTQPDKITFYPTAFDGLVTDEVGDADHTPYVIRVNWNPLGKEYDKGTEPTPMDISLQYKKGLPTIEVDSYHKVYDGKPIANINYSSNSTGDATPIFYKATKVVDRGQVSYIRDENPLTEAPKDAGYYYIGINIKESDDYQEGTSGLVLAYIEQKLVNAYIQVADKYYDGTYDAEVKEVIVQDGLANEIFHYEDGLNAEFKNKEAGTNKKVEITNNTGSGDGYEIEWTQGPGYADPKNYILAYHVNDAEIMRRPLGIQVANIAVEYSEKINISEGDFYLTETHMPEYDDPNPNDEVDETIPQGMVDGEAFDKEIHLSYSGDVRNVNVVNGEVVPHQIPLSELSLRANNYELYIVDEDGYQVPENDRGEQTVPLLIYQRDLSVNWKATNEKKPNDPISLKEEGSKQIQHSLGNGSYTYKTKILQNNTVIYNGYPYTVEISGLNGIINNDKVVFGVEPDSNVEIPVGIQYVQTDPHEKMQLQALQLQDDLLHPDTEFTENKNWNYIIPESPKNDNQIYDTDKGPYRKNFEWNIKYLDEYYYEDKYDDDSDDCHRITVDSTVELDSVSKSFVTGEGGQTGFNTKFAELQKGNWVKANPLVDAEGNPTGETGVVIRSSYVNYGYKIAMIDPNATQATADADWQDAITLKMGDGTNGTLKEGQNTFTYAVKDASGYITSVRQASINVDAGCPTVGLTVNKVVDGNNTSVNIFDEIFDDLFGFFSKEEVVVNISTFDPNLEGGKAPSGIKFIYYGVAPSEDDYAKNGIKNWTKYTDFTEGALQVKASTTALKLNQTAVVYVYIEDIAGNVTLINSEGLVIYNDGVSGIVTPEGKDYHLLKRAELTDLSLELTTLDHPISSIYSINTKDENGSILEILNKDQMVEGDYSIDEGTEKDGKITLTIKKEYLDSLGLGSFNIYVKYAPQGEAWNDSWLSGWVKEDGKDTPHGDKPTETCIPILIERSEGKVEINEDYAYTLDANNEQVITHTYNGTQVGNPSFTTTNENKRDNAIYTFTREKVDGEWANYAEGYPKNADTYSVKVWVPQNDYYTEAFDTLDFTIAPKEITLGLPVADKVYDATDVANLDRSETVSVWNEGFATGIGSEKIKITNSDDIELKFDASEEDEEITGKDVASSKSVSVVTTPDQISLEGVDGTLPANYIVSYKASNAAITQKDATIKVTKAFAEYGDRIPTFAADVEGVCKDEDGNDESIGTYVLKTNAQQGYVPNKYDVELDETNSILNPNYKVSVAGEDAFEITQRVVEIVWKNVNRDETYATTFTDSFNYDGNEHNVTPVIDNVYVNAEGIADRVSLVYTGSSATRVPNPEIQTNYTTNVTGLDGTHKDRYKLPTIIDDNDNEIPDPDKVSKDWTIVYAERDKNAKVEFNEEKWYNCDDVEIKAPEGYTIAFTDTVDAGWSEKIVYSQDTDADGEDVTYFLRNEETLDITSDRHVTVKRDTDVPGVDIQVEDVSIKKILNDLTFGLFFKTETLTVEVEATDTTRVDETGSGIASIEYLYSDSLDVNADTEGWESLANIVDNKATFEITPSKGVVFVKVTDNAGNFIIKNSDGVVVYVNSEIVTTGPIRYTRNPQDTEDTLDIQTNLKGNTVKEITIDGKPLDTKWYTVQYNSTLTNYGLISIANEYLQSEALKEGTYNIKISYYPQGVTTEVPEGTVLPDDTTIQLNVYKNEIVPVELKAYQFNYTGKPISVEAVTTVPVLEIAYAEAESGVYTTDKPTEAGTYDVRVTVGEDDYYRPTQPKYFEIQIKPYNVEIEVETQTITYGAEIEPFDFDVRTDLPDGKTKDDLAVVIKADAEVNDYGKVDVDKYNVELISYNENYVIKFANKSNQKALIVNPKVIEVAWGTTSFDYDAKPHGITPYVSNTVLGETCEIEIDGTLSASEAKTYRVKVTDVYNDNYTKKGAVVECAWTISHNADDALQDAVYVDAPDSGWYNQNVVLYAPEGDRIVAPEGYEISTQGTSAENELWGSSLEISQEGEDVKQTYYLRNKQTRAITDQKYVTVSIDKTAPNGYIEIKENPLRSFIEDITFGIFCKDNVDVIITGDDSVEGIKTSGVATIEYQLSEAVLTEEEALNGTWISGSSLNIDEAQKVIVYAKITDRAGNYKVINSDNLIVYVDVEETNIPATYIKTTMTDLAVDPGLNGNTVKAVNYVKTSEDKELLNSGYSVVDGEIVFEGEYLDGLTAGTHKYEVSYHPLGIPTVAEVDLASTIITITVKKHALLNDPQITLPEGNGLVYSREGIGVDVAYTGNNDGVNVDEFVVSYKQKDAPDSDYTTAKPVDAGNYIAKVVLEDDNYFFEATREFTISPRPITGIVWPTKTEYIYTENPISVVPRIEGILTGDEIELSYTGTATATAVDSYKAKVASLGNNNYTLGNVTNEYFDWSIVLGSVSDDILQDLVPNTPPATADDYYKGNVTINAPEGKLIRIQGSEDDWSDHVTIDESGLNKVKLEIKDIESNEVSVTDEMEFFVDNDTPSLEVTIGGNKYSDNVAGTAPSVFAEGTLKIPVEGDDDTTDVKLSYQVVPEGQQPSDDNWSNVDGDEIVIEASVKGTLYVKATDKVGNEKVIKASDIVVYKDAEQGTTSGVTYVKPSEVPVTANVVLNGNSIDEIMISGPGIEGSESMAGHFTTDGNGNITFDPAYLENLSEGEYQFTISYDPFGEEYESADGNEPPATTTITLVVENSDDIISEKQLDADDFAKTYDGGEVENPALTQNAKGQEIVYEYKVQGADDATYSFDEPVAAGAYTVRITAKANGTYAENVEYVNFVIAQRDVTVNVIGNEIVVEANDSIRVSVNKINVDTIAAGHRVQSIQVTGTSTERVTDNGSYTLSNIVIIDEDDNDVTGNYNVEYVPGTLKVTHDTSLAPNNITVDMPTQFTAGDSLSKDDIQVKLFYTDGYEKVVTDYDSNISSIDMTKMGDKTVKISYTENGQTIRKEIGINVAHNPNSKADKVEATLTDYDFEVGERLTLDGIVVKVTYKDGYQENVTDFVTNMNKIDMTTPGVKTLIVSYTKDGVTVNKEILVVVTEVAVDDPNAGDGEFEIIHGDGAPETTISNSNVEELKESLLTEEEKVEIAAGESYKIYLEVKDIEDSVSEADKSAVDAYMESDQKLGAYIDISLYTKVGDKEATKITDSQADIQVAIEIPEELLPPSDVERTYYVVRVHELPNGEKEVTVIDGIFNKEDNTFTFETDRFSTYAIIYTDVTSSDDSTSDSGQMGYIAAILGINGTNVEVPKTGDEATPFVWSFALVAALGAFGVCVKKLTKKRR